MTLIHVDLLYVTARRPKGTRPQPWRWIAKNGENNKILARSSERYTNKDDCIAAIEALFGTSANVYLRQKEHGNVALRLANQYDFSNIATTAEVLDQIADAAEAAETVDDDGPDNVA